MILFLDFDGTLHPNWEMTDKGGRMIASAYSGPWLVEASALASLIEPYSEKIDIVISSWWAYTRSLPEVKGLLPEVIASRIVDSVWLPHLRDRYREERISRYQTIQLWLDHHEVGDTREWLALDDDANEWPAEFLNRLVHADGTLGNPAVKAKFFCRLKEILGAKSC